MCSQISFDATVLGKPKRSPFVSRKLKDNEREPQLKYDLKRNKAGKRVVVALFTRGEKVGNQRYRYNARNRRPRAGHNCESYSSVQTNQVLQPRYEGR